MKPDTAARVIARTVRLHPLLSLLMLGTIVLSIVLALLPPLVLERAIDTLAAGDALTPLLAISYFAAAAAGSLTDAAKESLITMFGQKATHALRSAMCRKLDRLPASFFVRTEPGATVSRMVQDVAAVDTLFTSGIISMAADLGKLLSIALLIFRKSLGLALLLLAVTPLVFWMTRVFQKRMLRAQLENRVAVGQMSAQIPEAMRNIRTIHVLRQSPFFLRRYAESIDRSFRAQERSNFYDAIYSPIILFLSAALVGVMMAASVRSGTVQQFFGMSAGTAAALIAYVGSFFGPLESIGMEIQNVQSAVAGVQRINEFLREPELPPSAQDVQHTQAAVELRGVTFRYREDEVPLLQDLTLRVVHGEHVILAGRTGVGKSTLVKLIAGLYRPEEGEVRIFGRAPDAIPDAEKRRIFGYVEQQFHPIAGTVGEQISLCDPAVTQAQIEAALSLVGMEGAAAGLDTPFDASLFSQGQLQLLSIARAVVCNPALLLLDEITANLDTGTEAMVLTALRAAVKERTVISVSHRLCAEEQDHARVVTL